MEYRKAVVILMEMLDNHSLNTKEKEAVLTVIGLLDWAAIGKKRMRMKARKARQDKNIKW